MRVLNSYSLDPSKQHATSCPHQGVVKIKASGLDQSMRHLSTFWWAAARLQVLGTYSVYHGITKTEASDEHSMTEDHDDEIE